MIMFGHCVEDSQQHHRKLSPYDQQQQHRHRKMQQRLYRQQQQEDTMQLGAIFMLVSNWKSNRGRKCDFNSSIDSLATNWYPHNPHPIILMETKPWKRSDMIAIKRRWSELDFKFINVEKEFKSQPTIPESEFEDRDNPLSGISYKRMCHFFFNGFTEVPLLMEYKYLMRMDDDTCLKDKINYDIWRRRRWHMHFHQFGMILEA